MRISAGFANNLLCSSSVRHLGYLTAGVEIFDFRFCGRANVVVTS